MRRAVLLCGGVLFVAAISPPLVLAQFQQPTDEELKMTSDPKAPGAAAVYLNISEIADDPLHYRSTYERIKVLTEKGKELATVEIPYLKGNWRVSDIKGRTIHADGTVSPLNVKPEDLLSVKSGEWEVKRVVFTLPSVEVGSILEYKYELHSDDNYFTPPFWRIQRPSFVHSAHYQFRPFKAFMPQGTPGTDTVMFLEDGRGRVINALTWWYRLPQGATVKTSVNGFYSLDVSDVPPIPDEEWMPPLQSFSYKVDFYYMPSSNVGEFWMNEAKFWSKDVDKFAESSKAIKAAVDGIVAPSDNELDKAKKLYAAVQALDNTDYSRKKSESEMKELKIKVAKHAEDTWQQKSGSSEDIAMLYLAMLRAAGLTAFARKVVDRDKGVFDPSNMRLSQLDSTLVVLNTGGQQILLDPGEKMCPFATVSWRHSDTKGLGQSAQGPVITSTQVQQYKDNATSRTGDVTMDAHGAITGSFTIIMTGQEALRWRHEALRTDSTELKKEFDRELERIVPEGVEAHIDHFLALDQPDANLLALVRVTGSLGAATAKRIMLPGFFFDTRAHQPFVNEEKREVPVDMHYGDTVSSSVTYHLPEGLTVEGAPQDANISWSGHAMYVVKTKTMPGQIAIASSLAKAFDEVKPEEYQDLRGFYQKVAAAEQQQIVLTNVPPATGKGN